MKKILVAITFFMCLSTILIVSYKDLKQQTLQEHSINMPIEIDNEYSQFVVALPPIEQREPEYIKWLNVSLKIEVSGGSGSGTIVYFNPDDGYAYVQSCGHLWNGNADVKECARRKLACNVITWYHNGEKLTKPKRYKAEVLYYNNNNQEIGDLGKDCSLLRFKPDWEPEYFPIAPEKFEFKSGEKFHSLGCDEGKEVAHYMVKFVGFKKSRTDENYADLVFTENGPRPGRSGGGLMTDDYYVGVCWATTDRTGRGLGNGLFTPIKAVREYNDKNGYGWLNEVGINLARRIPIIDRNNPQGKYKPDYIPLPTK